MLRMLRLAGGVVVARELARPGMGQAITRPPRHDVHMQMGHRLIGEQALVRLDVDVHAGVQLLRDLGGRLARLAEDLGGAGILDVLARDDEDVALGDGADGLDDQEVLVPRPVVDSGDGVLDVLHDRAEEAFSLGEGDHGLGTGGHLGFGGGGAGWV